MKELCPLWHIRTLAMGVRRLRVGEMLPSLLTLGRSGVLLWTVCQLSSSGLPPHGAWEWAQFEAFG